MRKNFKKISAMVMAICLGMGLLTGCGSRGEEKGGYKAGSRYREKNVCIW